jgi:cation diffusion facilitator family transporter
MSVDHQADINKRKKAIVRTSIIGVLANFLLAAFKALVGILSNSIAIILDAVNNLSDMMSSIVTLVGVHIGDKAPDKKHPMGHGRYEYLSTAIIAVIIMYIGVTAFIESIKKIISPDEANYTSVTFVIVSVAIIVKILVGIYFRKVGKRVDSDSLRASGTDALFDSIVSTATLVAAIIFLTTGVAIEAYLAAAISLLIVYSGYKMLRGIFSVIVGERADPELSKQIKTEIKSLKGVEGAFDLILHDYGPNMTFMSVNIEVEETISAREIDDISREIRRLVFYKHHIYVNSVGIYSINTKDEEINAIYRRVKDILSHYEHVVQMHGFHVDRQKKEISFDVVIGFGMKNRRGYYLRIKRHLHAVFPKYKINIAMDIDYAD